jgi:hypothetical protein
VERAESLFDRPTGYANDLGLLAEEIDAATGELHALRSHGRRGSG